MFFFYKSKSCLPSDGGIKWVRFEYSSAVIKTAILFVFILLHNMR